MRHQHLKVVFVTLTKNSSVVTHQIEGSWRYPHHQKWLYRLTSMCNMELKLSQYFFLLIEKPHTYYWIPKALWCSGYHYCTTSSTAQVQTVLVACHWFKQCLRHEVRQTLLDTNPVTTTKPSLQASIA